MKITVTKDDWDNGGRVQASNCAVARAMNRAVSHRGWNCQVVGSYATVWVHSLSVRVNMPQIAMDLVRLFDGGAAFPGERPFYVCVEELVDAQIARLHEDLKRPLEVAPTAELVCV